MNCVRVFVSGWSSALLEECEIAVCKCSDVVDADEPNESELHPLATQAEEKRIDAEETLSVSVFEDDLLLQNEISEVPLISHKQISFATSKVEKQ